LPATVDEDLSTKPTVQQQFLALTNKGLGDLDKVQQRNYLNFYGNLMKASDKYLVRILEILESRDLLEKTLVIRTSDHGEMGLAHGGQRQKNFNVYEESLRVPLIYSNPALYPSPQVSDAMVSHVDFLPTLASLFKAPSSACADWQGVDYSTIVLNPQAAAPQKYIVFTYDDYQSGQSHGPYPGPLNHIVSIRDERYKLAKYYDANRADGPYEWEMYDLASDPLETKNLAYREYQRTPQEEKEFLRLQAELAAVERTRLQPLPPTR
jgi:arylsulfatase A-like enzyme